MRVFVLTTGRSGSKTFAEACRHLTNYTVGHESRSKLLAAQRVEIPDQHIEVDNRLSWMLGRLGEVFPDEMYVHLTRDPQESAESFGRRFPCGHFFTGGSIASAYRMAILQNVVAGEDRIALDLVGTVNANIRHFLRDKEHVEVECGDVSSFRKFLASIGARGNLEAARRTFSKVHNASRVAG